MKKLTKKVKKEIKEYIENNQPKMDWNSADFDKSTVEEILEKGMNDFIDDLWEYNIEYSCDMENYLIQEIQKEWEGYDQDEIAEFSLEHISIDMNKKNLLSNLPDVVCLAKVYSNYDCANSFDKLEPESYLGEVYKRVKSGVKKDDYMWEFYNGAYGGSLFCFIFRTDIENALELKENIKTGNTIHIPKGTQFGFFSSFSGSGSVFEKRTYRDMVLPLHGETEYDSIGITPDITQSYSMGDVYGSTGFVNDGNISIK